MPHHPLGYKKHAFQVYIENGVKIVFRHVPEVRAFLQARVIDQDVDLAESQDRLLYESLPGGDFSDIRLKSSATPFQSGDSFNYLVGTFFIFPVTNRDVSAFLRQTLCDSSP